MGVYFSDFYVGYDLKSFCFFLCLNQTQKLFPVGKIFAFVITIVLSYPLLRVSAIVIKDFILKTTK